MILRIAKHSRPFPLCRPHGIRCDAGHGVPVYLRVAAMTCGYAIYVARKYFIIFILEMDEFV